MRTTPLSVALPLAVLATTAAAPPRARAQPVAAEPRNEARTTAPVELARYVPGIVAADVGAPAGTGSGWAGYDGATRTPLVGATADVRLGRRVVLGAGATYAARDRDERAEVRPSVFARVQILDQTHHGLDLGAAVAYRQDRFVTEEGLLQGTLSLGMHGDAGAILMSVGYGQDGVATITSATRACSRSATSPARCTSGSTVTSSGCSTPATPTACSTGRLRSSSASPRRWPSTWAR